MRLQFVVQFALLAPHLAVQRLFGLLGQFGQHLLLGATQHEGGDGAGEVVQGLTIILVEHVMDAIRSLCDRCVVMSSGAKIAEGTPDEVLSDREVIRAYLGDDDA